MSEDPSGYHINPARYRKLNPGRPLPRQAPPPTLANQQYYLDALEELLRLSPKLQRTLPMMEKRLKLYRALGRDQEAGMTATAIRKLKAEERKKKKG